MIRFNIRKKGKKLKKFEVILYFLKTFYQKLKKIYLNNQKKNKYYKI